MKVLGTVIMDATGPLLLVLAGIIAESSNAHAAFEPVLPADCPSYTEVDWTFNMSNSGTGAWELPQDPDTSLYMNNIFNVMQIVGNGWTRQFCMRLDFMDMEYHYDHVSYGYEYTGSLTGPIWACNFTNPSDPSETIQEVPPLVLTTTDSSVQMQGFSFGRARVCHEPGARGPMTTAASMVPQRRYSGLLLGTGDVVYLRVPSGTTKTDDNSDTHDTFALWGRPGADFDLYERCGALPTATAWDARGYSSDSQEFLHLSSADCPKGSERYIAVHSFAGSGWFNIVNHKHYAIEDIDVVTAGADCAVTDSQLNVYADDLTQGFRHFFGANEGARYFRSIQLKSNAGGNIKFYCSSGRPHSSVCDGGSVSMYSDWHDGRTISHELGHYYNCLRDEYSDGKGNHCGHSIMASQFNVTQPNYCYASDHNKDPSPLSAGTTSVGAVWTKLINRTPYMPWTTPDTYDYINFDFNDMYAFVKIIK